MSEPRTVLLGLRSLCCDRQCATPRPAAHVTQGSRRARAAESLELSGVQILETKIRKLEQLVRLKDAKIQALVAKMAEAGAQ